MSASHTARVAPRRQPQRAAGRRVPRGSWPRTETRRRGTFREPARRAASRLSGPRRRHRPAARLALRERKGRAAAAAPERPPPSPRRSPRGSAEVAASHTRAFAPAFPADVSAFLPRTAEPGAALETGHRDSTEPGSRGRGGGHGLHAVFEPESLRAEPRRPLETASLPAPSPQPAADPVAPAQRPLPRWS